MRIWRKFGGDSLKIIQTDPFRLTEVPGVGFLTADAIAQNIGIPRDDPSRIAAGILHTLTDAAERGHIGMPMPAFRKRVCELLGVAWTVNHEHVTRMTTGDVRSGISVGAHPEHGECVFLEHLLAAEGKIARILMKRRKTPPVWAHGRISEERAREWTLREAAKCNITLTDAQIGAVVQALTCSVSILTGGPGTGKTSTLRILLRVLESIGAQVVLGAPTGKAAKRMQETTGREARTLARLIGAGRGADASDVTIEGDILVIDEASMVDVRLMRDVLERMAPSMALLLVGDVDQLPSVGPGNVLGDLIDSGCLPTTRLTEVFRQAAESAIVRNAHRVNHGLMPEPNTPGSDFAFIQVEDAEQIAPRVLRLVTDVIPARFGVSTNDIQVLSPMRKGNAGVDALNAAIQQAVNPNPPRKLTRGNRTFAVGDRVVQNVNNYDLDVMNGESGTVVDVREDDGVVIVDVDGVRAEYPVANLDQLSLAYAMTVHKSQGSQFPVVIIPVTTQHYVMLQRSIIYTAMTRATKLCVFVGQKRALTIAVHNVNTERRVTMLRSAIEGIAALE
jgi:exodeoxyribonuclease V alpha subunit